MILKKRERAVGLAALAMVLLLALDRLALSPYQSRREALVLERQEKVAELGRARRTISRWQEAESGWITEIPLAAAGNAGTLAQLRNKAEESGLSLSLLRPESSELHGSYRENIYQLGGTGTLARVVRFLELVENSGRPLRIRDLQLSTRREDTDELAIRLSIGELAREAAPAVRDETGTGDQP